MKQKVRIMDEKEKDALDDAATDYANKKLAEMGIKEPFPREFALAIASVIANAYIDGHGWEYKESVIAV